MVCLMITTYSLRQTILELIRSRQINGLIKAEIMDATLAITRQSSRPPPKYS